MDIDNWAGVERLDKYHAGTSINCMIAIPDGRVLASMNNDICILTPPSFTKQVIISMPCKVRSLLPFPHFSISSSPFLLFYGDQSVGFIDLEKKEYKKIENGRYGTFNWTSKLQVTKLADDSLEFATTRDNKVAIYRVRW